MERALKKKRKDARPKTEMGKTNEGERQAREGTGVQRGLRCKKPGERTGKARDTREVGKEEPRKRAESGGTGGMGGRGES